MSKYDWIHDDITWCGNTCDNTDCFRNMANKLSKKGMFSMALFKDTTTCPIYIKEHTWVKVHGYVTPGGDPLWGCPKCGGTKHLNGLEVKDPREVCEVCGQRNYYSWEFNKRGG